MVFNDFLWDTFGEAHFKDSEGAKLMKDDEKKFSIFLRDMILNFLLAGRDTTAQCLTWTLFELAQEDDFQTSAWAAHVHTSLIFVY